MDLGFDDEERSPLGQRRNNAGRRGRRGRQSVYKKADPSAPEIPSAEVITEALPMLTVRLVELGLSSEVKPYAQTQAILGTFSIIDKGVTDKENAEQLAKVRETLERLDWRAGRST